MESPSHDEISRDHLSDISSSRFDVPLASLARNRYHNRRLVVVGGTFCVFDHYSLSEYAVPFSTFLGKILKSRDAPAMDQDSVGVKRSPNNGIQPPAQKARRG
jgi:hypothetical protein